LFVDIVKGDEVDIFDKEGVSEIKSITSDDENFWILGNRKQNDKGISNLGIYLFSINLTNPRGESNYLLQWTNKLDIADSSIFIMNHIEKCGHEHEFLIISYKSIGINTFNVFVIDLEDNLIKYWHEGFQLWES